MASLPKGFAIGATKKIPRTKQKANRKEPTTQEPPRSTTSIPPKVTEVMDLGPAEDAPSKRQKSSIPPDQSMVHAFLGAASIPHIPEEELKKWSFRTEEQTNQAMIRAAAELHFHSIQNQSMNARIRTRLAASETEKGKLQDQLKKYGDQLDKLSKAKEAEILELQVEKARLEGVIAAMEKEVSKVTASNVELQLGQDVLNDEKLHGWAEEKTQIRNEGFSQGFNEWCSGFIANDPEYTFEKFDAETQQWVKDFKVREAASIQAKRKFLGLDEDEEDATPAPSPFQARPPSPPTQDAPPA